MGRYLWHWHLKKMAIAILMPVTDYDTIPDYALMADAIPGNALYERPATLALLPPLENLDVLDAGCGNGFYSAHAADAGARVVAFDPSKEMIAYAKERVGDRCELHHCRTEELEQILSGRKFDLILSCLVLHYVQDLARELSLLAGLLKPDGQIIVSMKHPLLNLGLIEKRGYRAKSLIKVKWSGLGDMISVQRPLGDITSSMDAAGLYIDRFVEAKPEPEMEEKAPAQYRLAALIPFFVHFILKKR